MSRNKLMKNALYSVHKLYKDCNSLSFATQANYEATTKSFIRELHSQGFPISNIKDLKPKNIDMLLHSWEKKGLSSGTIKNKLSVLRYVCKGVGKESIIAACNSNLSIQPRQYVPIVNKAIFDIPIEKIKNKHVQLSMRLQQEFGLRKEESLKFIASQADKGSYIELQASWTKGGIRRIIPVQSETQRTLLDEIKAFVPDGASLIPQEKSYIQHRNYYDYCARDIGLKNLHGLRHAYAQSKYEQLTNIETNGRGWNCPHQGGLSYKKMTPEQKLIDRKVRFIISNELGHSRVGITKIYCG